MKIEQAQAVFAQRKEKPCFNIADIYPADVCFEELRYAQMLANRTDCPPPAPSKTATSTELDDILNMFQQPLLAETGTEEDQFQQDPQSDSSEEDEAIRGQFEEKTCTLVQLPVSKLSFTKLEVYKSPSVKKLKDTAGPSGKAKARFPLKPLSIVPADSPSDQTSPTYNQEEVENNQDLFASNLLGTPTPSDSKNKKPGMLDDLFSPVAGSPGFEFNLSGDDFKWFNAENARMLFERSGMAVKARQEPVKFSISPKSYFTLNETTYFVQQMVGEGSYGKVYSATDEEDEEALVIKICDIDSGMWEYYVLQHLDKLQVDGIPKIKNFGYDKHQVVLVMPRVKNSLLDLINLSPGLDEMIVFFYLYQILKTCVKLWKSQIIHCDIKPEHLMLRFPQTAGVKWSGSFNLEGKDGWNSVGTNFIDFGQALDLSLIDAQGLKTTAPMAQSRKITIMDDYTRFEWGPQIDFIGIAMVMFMIIWKQDFEISPYPKNGPWNHAKWLEKVEMMPYRRSWDKKFWTDLFQQLITPINASSIEETLSEMGNIGKTVLGYLEKRLVEESEMNGKSLIFMLKRLNISLQEQRIK